MGVVQLFDKFYKNVEPAAYQQGQICWIPVPNIDPIPRILDVEREDAEEHDRVKFCLRNANQKHDFKKSDRSLPIKYLNLKSNEELLVQCAKKRPAVIISSGLDIYPDISKILRQQGRKHLQEDSLFFVPIYSIQNQQNLSGFPHEMVLRIRYCLYRQFYFLPQGSGLGEGIVRFDRFQTVIGRNPASVNPTPICLDGEFLAFFIGMINYCLTGIENQHINEIRSLLRAEYPGD